MKSNPKEETEKVKRKVTDSRFSEQGSATVVIIGVCVAVFIVVGIIPFMSAVHTRKVLAGAIADLAALAAADIASMSPYTDVGNQPCDRAKEIVRANMAILQRCETKDADVRLQVAIDTNIPAYGFLGSIVVTEKAHAGPAPPR
ncbi:Rv3654c family TadE-like protein [Schaalia sp. lx-260]|uniref:Rv3654c family TadE-like protein n=1 Tax=Schaalia sp. lx-260 TaxID=2899082 RepID=UPI001E4B1AD4|nr:Rv3654c family TadE-like protein [Schaalia sp. lx-260]MCD4548838.1 hypothetical protein [Schaalia sp. lx-260]